MAGKVTNLAKYLDFLNVFLKKSAVELSECSDINKYLIDLELGKQPPYGPIYRLGLVKLKILKTYIEINLANNFIRPFNFLAKATIFFV